MLLSTDLALLIASFCWLLQALLVQYRWWCVADEATRTRQLTESLLSEVRAARDLAPVARPSFMDPTTPFGHKRCPDQVSAPGSTAVEV